MTKREGILYLIEDGPWLRVPCSRYGSDSLECAFVAWRVAYIIARETGEEITTDSLDHVMGLVVNDHDDPAYMVNQYGHGDYGHPREYPGWLTSYLATV